ncbi:MAG: MOSC domain-containing protein [Thalassobaculum sp.]|uniref:MOSC domain-containing protein n=1 Tax=Thalassobaculum sp. TaxID=2022740 RepID=UPI0032EB8E0D
MSITVAALQRYPVKGLSAQALATVELRAGRAIPHDRRFAVAHGTAPIDPAAPKWLSKAHFLQLMSNPRLAALSVEYDPETTTLVLQRGGRTVARGALSTQTGRTVIEQFFAAYLKAELRGAPRLVDRGDESFSDADAPFVSIINRASVADLERVVGRPVDPARFRGNILLDGAAPWVEFGWVGRRLRIGSAELTVEERIGRCAATNVDPSTGQRDLTVPRDLLRGFGHEDCGIYARVTLGGQVVPGDPVTVLD